MHATAMKSILSEEWAQPSRTSSAMGNKNTTSRQPGWEFHSNSCTPAPPPPVEAHLHSPTPITQKCWQQWRQMSPPRGLEKTEPHSSQGLHHRQVSGLLSFALLTCPRQTTAGRSLGGQGSFWFQGLGSALGKRTEAISVPPIPHHALL